MMDVKLCLAISWCFLISPVVAQDIYDARQSVIIQAIVQDSPTQITLQWVPDTANGGFTIWRKSIDDLTWGDSLIYLLPKSTSWTDTSVQIGIGYEYQILKSLPAFPTGEGTPNFGSGYIYAGIDLPPRHHYGSCLVVIERSIKQSLDFEITRLLDDLERDGWSADTFSVHRNETVVNVKAGIVDWVQNNPDAHQALFILGRVPVPYSGEIAPDGHHNDHRGAWPCDGYYGTIDGLWTDQIVNITTAAGTRNDNVPGDGKFDNSYFPSNMELEIGRVDFSNMNKFIETEEFLLKRYLDKNHAWRNGELDLAERGLIDNNYPLDLEALGQSGWRNFAVMFGIDNVKELPYRQTLSGQSFLWSYGCGGGGPESASDISSTSNFTTDSLQSMFTMLFGSYFGDWDYPNNFLRAAIASKSGLASTWGNRPNWFFHHMALGETIGYSTQITMNNRGLYHPRFYGGYVSTALMGDPTLRMHVVPPVEHLIARQEGLSVRLTWKGVSDATGYFIYRKYATDGAYHLLHSQAITDTTFLDACVESGTIQYLVRSSTIETSGSGRYYNLSAGVKTTHLFDTSTFTIEAHIIHASPGESNGSINILPKGSCMPYSFLWENGNTTSDLTQLSPGQYCVTISDCLNCAEVYCPNVGVSTSNMEQLGSANTLLFPNPTYDLLSFLLTLPSPQSLRLYITDINGRKLHARLIDGKEIFLNWDIQSLPAGQYWMHIESHAEHYSIPFCKISP